MTVERSIEFAHLRVAVAGDVIVDRTLSCEPKGLSREAPVMVLRQTGERLGAGGAANVARNVRALGASVALFGVVGRDRVGREVREILEAEGIDAQHVGSVPGWTTPTKTRVVAAEVRRFPQQVLRLDQDPPAPAERAERLRVLEHLRARAAEFDLLLVSDYEYGMVSIELARLASAMSAEGRVVVLDPRRRLEGFRGLTAMTPNVGELAALSHTGADELVDERSIERACSSLQSAARWALVTRGNLGMSLVATDGSAPTRSVKASGSSNVTDVSGAGDTAAAVFALALAGQAAPVRAMELANAASGIVVMESGAVPCRLESLRQVEIAPALAPREESLRP